MESILFCFLAVNLLLVEPIPAQKPHPISTNGKPLTFQVISAVATRDVQSQEQTTEAQLTGFNLQAATGSGNYTYRGPIKEVTNYVPIPLGREESFLVVEFSVANIKHPLDLSMYDVELIDGKGAPRWTLGSATDKKDAWFPFDSAQLSPKQPDKQKWIFKVPTDAVPGAVLQFQGVNYPLSVAP